MGITDIQPDPVVSKREEIKKAIDEFTTVLENDMKGDAATLEENNTISAWLFGISVGLFAFLFADENFRSIISQWIKTILLFHGIQLGLVLLQKVLTKTYKAKVQKKVIARLSMQKVYLKSSEKDLDLVIGNMENKGLINLFKSLTDFKYLKDLSGIDASRRGSNILWWCAIVCFILLMASFVIGYLLFIEAGWKLV